LAPPCIFTNRWTCEVAKPSKDDPSRYMLEPGDCDKCLKVKDVLSRQDEIREIMAVPRDLTSKLSTLNIYLYRLEKVLKKMEASA